MTYQFPIGSAFDIQFMVTDLLDVEHEFVLQPNTAYFGDQDNRSICIPDIHDVWRKQVCSVHPEPWSAPASGWSTSTYQPPINPPVVTAEPRWGFLVLLAIVAWRRR